MKFLTCLVALTFALSIDAQETLELKDYAVQVAGTSTLHAWTTQVNNVTGNLSLDEEGAPQAVKLEFEVASMESGRGKIMDDKTKKALSNETHPWIIFESNQIKSNGDQLEVMGDLNIGGKVKPVSVEVTPNGHQYTANVDLTFSLFDIEPPSAMFGQIKCGDNLALTFDLTF